MYVLHQIIDYSNMFLSNITYKRIILISILLISLSGKSQSIIGKWKTLHESTGKPVSIVQLYEQDGKIFGKIVEILEKEHEKDLCVKCKGEEKNKPVLGLTIIKNMEKVGKFYKKGTIFHPVLGKTFRCRIKLLDNPDRIQVRGYFLFLFGTQYWERVL